MKDFWTYVTYLTSFLTLSPVEQDGSQQHVIAVHNEINVINVETPVTVAEPKESIKTLTPSPIWSFPIFKPPTGRLKWAGSNFECVYPKMRGWEPCTGTEETGFNRSCWLRNLNNAGQKYDIGTDYEIDGPIGIDRNYTLVIEDGQWNTDGLWAKDAKLINGTYPGPLIQACWGDTLHIKVINKLKHNGTAMHWHGIRQYKSMHQDGVPGITQCPIAPGDSYTYSFKVTQYGDSWYHSHYSVQYADGLLGPMSLYGPTTGEWDEAKPPVLMSDWFHNSAFGVIHDQLPGYPTILLNGTGDITQTTFPENPNNRSQGSFSLTPNAPIPAKYTLHFEKFKKPTKPEDPKEPKKYLMRIINTSFTTHFVFSIDYHTITIVGADLVPIRPTDPRPHIQVGIGQRYTIIVQALKELPKINGKEIEDFWIRTTVTSCFHDIFKGGENYDRTGVLRYSTDGMRDPITTPQIPNPDKCEDEGRFVPQLKWKIPNPFLKEPNAKLGEELSAFRSPGLDTGYPLAKWSFVPNATLARYTSMQIDYWDPFFLHLNELDKKDWSPKWRVIPANYTDNDWYFMAITGWNSRLTGGGEGKRTDGAHPIHLHGHDFAVVQLETTKPYIHENIKLNLDNPSRRDVILLPDGGWIIIAFKTDNPGAWIMHCHIAFHASEGLGIQINERQGDANQIWPNDAKNHKFDSAIVEANRVCNRWKNFEHDCTQHWPGWNEEYNCYPACNPNSATEAMFACPKAAQIPGHVFQDDSGV